MNTSLIKPNSDFYEWVNSLDVQPDTKSHWLALLATYYATDIDAGDYCGVIERGGDIFLLKME